MPDYGKAKYWDDRYSNEINGTINAMSEPFDWLFDYAELSQILEGLLHDKNGEILLIGAGNAPFSSDLYSLGGYKNLVNMDLSPVAMDMQRALYPSQQWIVMDVLDMTFADGSVHTLIDKSLIDTLLCYNNAHAKTGKMISEVYRVLSPGSRYITFSLHSPDEVMAYMAPELGYTQWRMSAFRIRSSRWSRSDSKRRAAVAYTMVVCDKCLEDGSYMPNAQHPIEVAGSLSPKEYALLRAEADSWNFQCGLREATDDDLMRLLDNVLAATQGDLDALKVAKNDEAAETSRGAHTDKIAWVENSNGSDGLPSDERK